MTKDKNTDVQFEFVFQSIYFLKLFFKYTPLSLGQDG